MRYTVYCNLFSRQVTKCIHCIVFLVLYLVVYRNYCILRMNGQNTFLVIHLSYISVTLPPRYLQQELLRRASPSLTATGERISSLLPGLVLKSSPLILSISTACIDRTPSDRVKANIRGAAPDSGRYVGAETLRTFCICSTNGARI